MPQETYNLTGKHIYFHFGPYSCFSPQIFLPIPIDTKYVQETHLNTTHGSPDSGQRMVASVDTFLLPGIE